MKVVAQEEATHSQLVTEVALELPCLDLDILPLSVPVYKLAPDLSELRTDSNWTEHVFVY